MATKSVSQILFRHLAFINLEFASFFILVIFRNLFLFIRYLKM